MHSKGSLIDKNLIVKLYSKNALNASPSGKTSSLSVAVVLNAPPSSLSLEADELPGRHPPFDGLLHGPVADFNLYVVQNGAQLPPVLGFRNFRVLLSKFGAQALNQIRT